MLFLAALKRLPQCHLDVVLTASDPEFALPDLPRPLQALALSEFVEWTLEGPQSQRRLLHPWLDAFAGGTTVKRGSAGRPNSKMAWLNSNWRRFETELAQLGTDLGRTELLAKHHLLETKEGLSRPTVVKFLNRVMPDRATNCS